MNDGNQLATQELLSLMRGAGAPGPAPCTAADGFAAFDERTRRDFESSALPMRIFDIETLRYLAVNDAALALYGYSREEFLTLTVLDTRHPEEHAILRESLAHPAAHLRLWGIGRHLEKSGEVLFAEVITQDVIFEGRRARTVTSIDVTGRVRAQELLSQREREFETLAENLPGLIARFDRHRRFVYVNSAVEKLLDVVRNDVIGKTQGELGMPEALVTKFARSLDEAFETGEPHTLEFSMAAAGGERLFEAYHIPERGPAGQISTVLCVAHDITERKKSEEEVQRQKDLLAAIIDNLPVGVFIRDADTLRYVMRNRFLQESNGYPVDTSIGKSAYDLFPKEQADRSVATDREALESRRLVDIPEQEMLGKSGERRVYHVRKVPLLDDRGRPRLLVGIADDITERKRAERELRESNEFLRSVIASSRDCIKVLDLEGRLLSISGGGQRLLEVENETSLLGKSYLDFWHGGDRELARKALTGASTGGVSRFEAYCPTMKGAPKWWDELVTPILGKDGRPERILVVSRDITQHKRREDALRESEERFRQLAENIRQVFWINTLAGDKVIYVSAAYEEIWGKTRESLYREPLSWKQSIHPEDLPRVEAGVELMAQGHPVDVEYRILRPDGTVRWIRDRSYPMRSGDGTPLMCGIAEDITDTKVAEQERLTHAMHQRDALVREVHHRIKNSLQGVIGLLRQKIRKYPAVAPDIEEAIGQLQSLALVYGLQETRPDGLLSLAEITDAICSSVEKLIGGRVSRTFERESQGPACIAGAEAVSVAVALNELVFNALKHQPAQAGRKRATVRLSEAPGAAEIRITNRGNLPKNFDFTAGHSVGHGLGLVRTLLAPPGGTIIFNGGRDRVEVKLTLAPPLLARQGRTYAK